MQLNLFFHSLTLLCGLAAAVFATIDARPRAGVAMAATFVAATIAARPDRLPDPVWVGSLVAALGVLALMRPRWSLVVAAAGGALGGVWVALLQAAGTPLPAALFIAAGVTGLALVLTRRDALFAPAAIREEALLIVSVLGLAVGVAPGIAEGWQSAAILNLEPQSTAAQMLPTWTVFVTLGAVALGGLYTVWVRR